MTKKTSLSSRIYRFLIRLYPSDFRRQNEPEMNRYFEEAEREETNRRGGMFRLWLRLLGDLVRTLPREHWDMLRQDVRYTLRSLRKSPGFALATLLTLAVAIASNSVIFSAVHAVLMRPLPYASPDQLVLLRADLPKIGLSDSWLSEPEVLDLREESRLFSGFAAFLSSRVTYSPEQSVEPLTAGLVSANFLDLLGVPPVLGRGFRPQDELPNGPAVAILSHDFWLARFGGDPSVLGRNLTLDGREISIVGVAAKAFQPRFPARTRLPSNFDVWLPYQVNYREQDRHSHGVTVLGRMQAGVSLSEAQAELDAIATHLREQWYEKTGFALHALPLHADLTATARTPLLALLGAVLLVLLIACSNVANLLLARNSVRSREIAIRAAVGARWTRLARQIMTEGLILALLGGMSGGVLAALALPMLPAVSPADIPGLEDVTLNPRVLFFTLGCCLSAALLFSLTPAFQAFRQNRRLSRNLSSRPGISESGHTLRRLLIVGEVALAVPLLIAGGLMYQTLRALNQADLGYQPEKVLSVRLSLPSSRYSPERVVPFFSELEEQIGSLPGVQAVGSNLQVPLSGSSWSGTDTFYETTNGRSDERKEHFEVDQRVVTPGYFRAMGTALLKGRVFTSGDDRNSTPVVIIDETLAEQIWPGVDPVGKRMARGADPEEPFFFEIVGVVEHQRYHDLRSDGRPQVYYAESQLRFNSLSLMAKTTGDPSALIAPIRSLVGRMDPHLPIDSIEPLSVAVELALAPTRFTLRLLTLFAAIGLLLAGVGIFGVVNYTVQQQTREFAIRMALGASAFTVLRTVLRQALVLAALGVLIGGLAGLGVNRLLESLLFGISSQDLPTFLIVATLCLVLALLAGLLPALRATHVDPVNVLRGE